MLGARPGFLILKAAMMAVKAGLGWYLTWTQGWAAQSAAVLGAGTAAVVTNASMRAVPVRLAKLFHQFALRLQTLPVLEAIDFFASPREFAQFGPMWLLQNAPCLACLPGSSDQAQAGFSYPHQPSGGMGQCTAQARALVNEPSVPLLDEPLAKLDSLTRIAMQAELVPLWQRERITAFLVTHDVEMSRTCSIWLGVRPC